jgi:hypothetical protein
MKKSIILYSKDPPSLEEKVNNVIGVPDESVQWRVVLLPETKK